MREKKKAKKTPKAPRAESTPVPPPIKERRIHEKGGHEHDYSKPNVP
jgi:hypothetical protein